MVVIFRKRNDDGMNWHKKHQEDDISDTDDKCLFWAFYVAVTALDTL